MEWFGYKLHLLVDVKHEVANDVHQLLSEESLRAVIQNRALWKENPERMLPGHDGNSNIVYNEAGTLFCYDRVSSPIVRHPMAYIGYEPERETIKYRFPAIPRATKQFERLYNGRTAVERVNARLKLFWGVDDGNLRGARRFIANVGAVMVVHAAFATLLAMSPRREGTLGKLKLGPIARALRERAGLATPALVAN